MRKITWIDKEVTIAGVERKHYHTEIAFQTYCAQWIRKNRTDWKIHHSANEREGGKFGLRLKLMGQSKGFPDLLIFDPIAFVRMAIEFKVHGGKVSKEQAEWLEMLKSFGFKTAVVYTFAEFLGVVDKTT